MNIVKLGGSIINPDGKYDHEVIDQFIELVKNAEQSFVFIVGGGFICREIQDVSMKFLHTALPNEPAINTGRDEIGIAITKINARYVLDKFADVLGDDVHPEIILDPTQNLESTARVFFTAGWKPGHSTDTDMMLIAKTFNASKVFKISNFAKVKQFTPQQYMDADKQERKRLVEESPEIPKMTWGELHDLVGEEWVAGMNTPFDPDALKIGLEMRDSVSLYIGVIEEFFKAVKGKTFEGTIVSG